MAWKYVVLANRRQHRVLQTKCVSAVFFHLLILVRALQRQRHNQTKTIAGQLEKAKTIIHLRFQITRLGQPSKFCLVVPSTDSMQLIIDCAGIGRAEVRKGRTILD